MVGKLGVGLARLLGSGLSRSRNFISRNFDAIRQQHDREAAREAERLLEISGQKLTDETERKIMERLTRNQSFKP